MRLKFAVYSLFSLFLIITLLLLYIFFSQKYASDHYILSQSLRSEKASAVELISENINKSSESDYISNEIIIKFAPGQKDNFINSSDVADSLIEVTKILEDIYIYRSSEYLEIDYTELINEINSSEMVIYAEPNYRIEYQQVDSEYYFNAEYKFSFEYPSRLVPCCGISGPAAGDIEQLLVIGERVIGNNHSFDGLAVNIVKKYQGSLDEYLIEEKLFWSGRMSEVGDPGVEDQDVEVNIGNLSGRSLKGFFTDNLERIYVEIPNTQDILVLTVVRNEGFSEIQSVIDSFKFNVLEAEVAPSNDPLLEHQWNLSSNNDVDINGSEAWELEGDNEVVVALIDASPSTLHEDLQGVYWKNTDEIAGNGIDDDVNGYIDDVYGCSFDLNYSHTCHSELIADDGSASEGHGTISAGLIAASSNNGIGMAGICSKCKIMIDTVTLNFAEDSTAGVAQFVKSITYAADNGARIINASWGMPFYSQSLQDSINYARDMNVLFVAAAGNSGDDSQQYPARMDNVLSVASVDRQGAKSSFSTYGYSVDISAPGEELTSTNYQFFSTPGYEGYSVEMLNGTSFAAPQVTAVAGLLLTKNSTLKPYDLEYILKSTVKNLDVSTEFIGEGLVDAYEAMRVPYVPDIVLSIDTPKNGDIVSDVLNISGTITDAVFKDYSVSFGIGLYPNNWIEIYSSTQSVTNALILGNYDIGDWTPGVYTLKIDAEDGTSDSKVMKIRVIVE